MERFRSALIAVASVAIAAVAASCGSSKEEVSAAELVQRADGICREEQAKFDQIQARAPANASIAAQQTGELVEVSEAASSDLADLEPPESLRDAYDGYLEARERVVGEMKRGKEAAEERDSGGYAAAQTAVAKGAEERRRLAYALGLQVCGASMRAG
jgi:hypothetical protein